MPDIVNDDDLSALAAEYVLGTLEADERTRANVLLDVDHGFRGLVRVWERRLGELHLMVEPVEPPDARLWDRIRGRLGVAASSFAPPLPESPPVYVERAPEPKPVAVTPPPAAAPAPPPPPPKSAEEAEKKPATTPEQKLAELIMEVEKFNEVRPAEARAPEPPAPPPAAPEVIEERVEPLQPVETVRSAPERVLREPPPPLLPTVVPGPQERRKSPTGGWRAVALVMMFVSFGLGGLIAAWRFIPDQLPLQLRPIAFLRITDAPAQPKKPPAPPGSQFDE